MSLLQRTMHHLKWWGFSLEAETVKAVCPTLECLSLESQFQVPADTDPRRQQKYLSYGVPATCMEICIMVLVPFIGLRPVLAVVGFCAVKSMDEIFLSSLPKSLWGKERRKTMKLLRTNEAIQYWIYKHLRRARYEREGGMFGSEF